MEQKFKVGDLVRCIHRNEKPFGMIGKVVDFDSNVYSIDFGKKFDGHNQGGTYSTSTYWSLYDIDLELAYPSDHDLLDFAARDSMVAELKAENEALKAELEKWKPKPQSMTRNFILLQHEGELILVNDGDWYDDHKVIARKTVTITEGEGM